MMQSITITISRSQSIRVNQQSVNHNKSINPTFDRKSWFWFNLPTWNPSDEDYDNDD